MGSPAATAILSTRSIDVEADALLRRVAGGDVLAFETLHRHYTPRLMGYLLPRLEHRHLAEEVCQDVWMVVWQQASQFRFDSRFSTWLLGIAQRLVWKARTRRVNVVSEALPMLQGETEVESPETVFTGQHHDQQVASAVAALPPVLGQTITLHYHQDLTYREIGAQMGCSSETVKVRLQQARRRLGAKLRQAERPLAMAV